MLQRLRHPNLSLLLSIAIDELNNIYVVSEYVRHNRTLDYYISRKDCFKQNQKAEILFEVAKTLNYLHSLDPAVIHRNLRPENVYVTAEFRVKLVGFE